MKIEKNVDIVGLIGAVLGIFAAGWHAWDYFVGADVHLFAPQQVLLNSHDYGDGSLPVVRISARMAYANQGASGNNATIQSEQVSFLFIDEVVEQRWLDVHKVAVAEDGSPILETVGDAHPVPVIAGSSISREIYFAPFPERCADGKPDCDADKNFVSMADFAETLQVGNPMVLTFTSRLLGESDPLVQRCEIDVTSTMINDLETIGWFSAPCWTPDDLRP